MSQYVTDTHALYWHLTEDLNLSERAKTVLQETDAGQHRVFVPAYSPMSGPARWTW